MSNAKKSLIHLKGLEAELAKFTPEIIAAEFEDFTALQRGIETSYRFQLKELMQAAREIRREQKLIMKVNKSSRDDPEKLAERYERNCKRWKGVFENLGIPITDEIKELITRYSWHNKYHFKIKAIVEPAREAKKKEKEQALLSKMSEKDNKKSERIIKKIDKLLALAEDAGIVNNDDFNMLLDPENLQEIEAVEFIRNFKAAQRAEKKVSKTETVKEKKVKEPKAKREPKAPKARKHEVSALIENANSLEDFITDEELDAALADEGLIEDTEALAV